MTGVRTWLSVLLGAVLLVQGFAVSAASHAGFADAPAAQALEMVDMPCHGQKRQADKADAADSQERACCNAGCPDMTTCALGHLASVATVSVTLPPPVRPERGVSRKCVALRPFRSLLRPPIVLHS